MLKDTNYSCACVFYQFSSAQENWKIFIGITSSLNMCMHHIRPRTWCCPLPSIPFVLFTFIHFTFQQIEFFSRPYERNQKRFNWNAKLFESPFSTWRPCSRRIFSPANFNQFASREQSRQVENGLNVVTNVVF